MKVCIDREWGESCVYAMSEYEDDTLYVDVPEDFYKEYVKIMSQYETMQNKLKPLQSKIDEQWEEIRKSEKIEKLKQELKELESKK